MISVIIINYNGLKFSDKLIASLNSQTLLYDEAVVFDNNSNDSGCEKIASMLKNVTLYKSAENIGFASAVNRAVDLASNQDIILLNNDIRLDKNFIKNALKNLSSNSKTFFAPLVLNYDGELIDSMGDNVGKDFKPVKLNSMKKPEDVDLKGCSVSGFSMSASYFKKNDFINNGYLDERFFMYFEDVDFSIRLKRKGYNVMFTPETIAYHYISGATKSEFKSEYSPQKVFWESRNRVFMYVKNYNFSAAYPPLNFVLGTISSFVYHLLKTKYWCEYAEGFLSGIKNLKGIKKEYV